MSHLEKGAELPKHIISYDKSELKQARKAMILWSAAVYLSIAAWVVIGFMFIPLGIVQAIAGTIMLFPLIVTAMNGAEKRRVYAPLKKNADFINDAKRVFGNWMHDASLSHASSAVDIDVMMSSAKPGVMIVTMHWLMDAVSRPHHPEFAPMVFEVGDDFFSSYGADPRKVMPVLLNALSSDETARQHGVQLEKFFEKYALPDTARWTTPGIDIVGD